MAGACAKTALDRGKARLLGISKRGNRYLRKILVHGAHPPFSASSENDLRSAHGSMRLSCGRRSTWSSQRQPTSSPASHGRFYQRTRVSPNDTRHACLSLLPKMVFYDRPLYQDDSAAHSIKVKSCGSIKD